MVRRVPPWYIMALRCQFDGSGMGRDDEQASIVCCNIAAANGGHPHGANLWLAVGDIEGWSLLVQMQGGIECTALPCCSVRDMICKRVWCL